MGLSQSGVTKRKDARSPVLVADGKLHDYWVKKHFKGAKQVPLTAIWGCKITHNTRTQQDSSHYMSTSERTKYGMDDLLFYSIIVIK